MNQLILAGTTVIHAPTKRTGVVERVEWRGGNDVALVHFGLLRGEVVLACEHADHLGPRHSVSGALHAPVRHCRDPRHVAEHGAPRDGGRIYESIPVAELELASTA